MDKPLSLTQFIDLGEWTELLNQFIHVLKINIFLVDAQGQAILIPQAQRFGWELLLHSDIAEEIPEGRAVKMPLFLKHESYLEYQMPFGLNLFGLPVRVFNEPLAYFIIGPIILNRRRDNQEYIQTSKGLTRYPRNFLDLIYDLRVITYVDMHAVLGLLSSVIRNEIRIHTERYQQHNAAREILKDFLTLAVHITRASGGSIMLYEQNSNELVMQSWSGINDTLAHTVRIKMGDGIAGLAAQDNRTFVLHGTKSEDQRLGPLLKRREIAHALVMPLNYQNRIWGVMNLHTLTPESHFEQSECDLVQKLSSLAGSAMTAIQDTPRG